MLYYGTQHRRMSEVCLSEIEYAEYQDPSDGPDTLHDESYRLAAGFALGLINLGKGKDMSGLHDMKITERLLSVAVGGRRVNMVHILDQATAGAVIALALVFMKTHDKTVARKVSVPDTRPQFDFIRPDILLLRTVAKHVIMWDEIQADRKWVLKSLPADFAKDYLMRDIHSLRTEHLPLYNIMAGLLWSISLRHAGSGDLSVRDFLVKYLDQFIRLAHLPALRYDAKLTRNTVRNCQDLVALSCATVMAGTGDLDVFRRLRLLHGRANADTTYGSHMAAHMALGILFLGGGSTTLGTSNLAIASLMLSFYPIFPTNVTDNKAHLQAFRHFWVLATEDRCIVARDVDTQRAISLPFIVHLRSSDTVSLTAPCLLPDLDTIAAIITTGQEYWPVTLDFSTPFSTHLASFKQNQTILVRRRPTDSAHASVFSATLVALNDAQSSQTARRIWDWIFRLPAFADFDKAAADLVLPVDANSSVHTEMRGTVVDHRLVLKRQATSGWSRDELFGLRVLFAWAEGVQRKGGRLSWLGKEVVEGLRARVGEREREFAGRELDDGGRGG